MGELHPTRTAKIGHIPADDVIQTGRHRDLGPFSDLKAVWCKQCGFPCRLDRDARNIEEFSGGVITSGNVLSNGSFEDWTAGSPDSWTVTGTVTQNTTSGYYDWTDDGVSSCKITRSGSDISLSQSASTPSDFNSNILGFRARVKSGTSDVIRLRADVNGTSYYSNYNITQQRFQDLVVTVTCPTTVSSLTVYILADSVNGTAYVDSAILSRNGSPTTSAAGSGCPLCTSYNYY